MRKYGILVWISLLALTLCLGAQAWAEGVNLPVSLVEIGEEAFYGDDSLEQVTLSDAVRRIGPRAFARCENLTLIAIPASVTEIAEDAFADSGRVMVACSLRSTAYAYARAHSLGIQLEGNYFVSGITAEDGLLTVTLTAQEDCAVRVTALDEAETETLFSTRVDCPAGDDIILDTPCDGLSGYFVLRAELTDSAGNSISETYISRHYTAAYAAYTLQTADDFAADRVFSFGSAGFGVLEEGVLTLSDYTGSDGVYTVNAGRELRAGDCLILMDAQGEPEYVKVKTAVSNADGTCTVTGDSDITVADFFQTLKFDTAVDAVRALENGGRISRSARGPDSVDSTLTMVEYSTSHTFQAVTIKLSVGVSLRYKFDYDKKLLGEDYFEVENYVMVKGKASITVSAAVQSGDFKDEDGNPLLELPIFDAPVAVPFPGITVNLKISVPLDIKAEAESIVSIDYTAKAGFKYNPKDGKQPINSSKVTPDAEVKGKLIVKLGPKVSISLKMGKFVTAAIEGEFGGKFTAEKTFVKDERDKRHACALCFDVKASLYFDFTPKVSYKITEKVKGDFVKIKLLSDETTIFSGYASVINDADSVHGGHFAAGKGACPNYQYRVTVNTYDEEDTLVTGVPVEIRLLKDGLALEKASGASTLETFLYPGTYRVEGSFENVDVTEGLTVTYSPETVHLFARSYIVLGRVVDANDVGVPITDARVTVTLRDHSQSTCITNENGEFEFSLPEGHYTFEASHEYYASGSMTQTIGARLTNDVQIALVPSPAEVQGRVVRQSDGEPLEGATVTFAGKESQTAVTGKDGRYRLKLAAGEYEVTALADQCASQTRTESLSAHRQHTVNFSLPGEKTVRRLYGVVTSSKDGSLIEGAQVNFGEFAAMSDASGAYLVEIDSSVLAAMTEDVRAIARDYAEYNAAVTLPEEGDLRLDIPMRPLQTALMVKVFDGTTWEEVPSVTFSLADADGHSVDVDFDTFAPEDGWTKYTVPPGEYTLTTHKTGYKNSIDSVMLIENQYTYLRVVLAPSGYYTLRFEGIPGRRIDPMVVKKGDTVTLPDGMEIAEYSFCWQQVSVYNEFFYPANGSYTLNSSSDMVLHAGWTAGNLVVYGYRDEGSKAYVLGYRGKDKDTVIVVDSSFAGCPVEEVGPSAFYMAKGKGIVLPYGIRKIDDQAFLFCTLESVIFPDSVTEWGTEVLKGSKQLRNVTLPAGITYIPESLFINCRLYDYVIPNTVRVIEPSAFEGCGFVTTQEDTPDVILPPTVVEIESKAFYGSSLKSVVIPYGVKTIGDHAFYNGHGLETVSLPNSVVSLGHYAFSEQALREITLSASLTEIPYGLLYNCRSLKKVTIPYGCTKIGFAAFKDCKSLQEVSIPSSVTEIDQRSFWGCTALKQIALPSGLLTMGQEAFRYCSSLESIALPASLDKLNQATFAGCSGLVSVDLGTISILDNGMGVFSGCSSLETILFSPNLTAVQGFGDSKKFTRLVIPEGIVSIGGFTNFTALTELVLPDTLKNVAMDTFKNCSALASVTFPSGVEKVLHRSFNNCASLESVTVAGLTTWVTDSAFKNCPALTTLYTPEGSKAEAWAQNNHPEITVIHIPAEE